MRETLSLVLAFALLFSMLFLSSCDKNLPQDSELTEAAAALIEKSLLLDRLFFVEGIAYVGDDSEAYREADGTALAKLGFVSYADIAAYARRYYSAALFSDFESLAVKAQINDNQLLQRAYCYDMLDEDDRFVSLMVSTDGLHRQMDKTVYDMSTLRVTEKMKDSAKLSVSVTVTSRETGETQTKEKRISLVREGEWKLDALTCIAYFVPPQN